MKNYKSREFEEEKGSQELTYVLFKDNLCSLCGEVLKYLKEVETRRIPVYVVDLAKNRDLIEKYSISDIPTVIVFRKGRIIDMIQGKHPRRKYLKYC